MIRHGPVVVSRDGQVYATREGVSLFACPECCIDLLALAGDANADTERAIALMWNRRLDRDWNALEALFTDLGSGHVETRASTVVLDGGTP